MASTDYVGGLFWVLKIIVLYENALSPIGRASVERLVYSSSISIIIIKGIKECLLDHFSHGYGHSIVVPLSLAIPKKLYNNL